MSKQNPSQRQIERHKARRAAERERRHRAQVLQPTPAEAAVLPVPVPIPTTTASRPQQPAMTVPALAALTPSRTQALAAALRDPSGPAPRFRSTGDPTP